MNNSLLNISDVKIKSKYIFFIFLLSIFQVKGQQLDFFHFIPIPEFMAFDVKQTDDGGYLIAGGVHNINGGDFKLIKTDSSGNLDWTYSNDRFDGFNGSNRIFSLTILDGFYYLAGEIYDLSGSSSSFPIKIYIVKMDSLLNKIWEMEDTITGGRGGVNKIRVSNDKKLLLTGSILSNDSSKLYCAKIDTSGQLIWKQSFYFGDDQTGNDIMELNSDYVVGGYILSIIDSPFTSIDTSSSILMKFDSTGIVKWHYEYPDTIYNGFSSILKASDGNIYCGQFYAPMYENSANPNSAILKFDSLGSLIYRKEFQNSNSRITDVFEKPDETLIVAYDFMNVLFLNSLGDSITSYRHPGYLLLKNSILDEQKRVVLVGHYKPNSSWPYTSYIMRVSDTTLTGIAGIENISSIRIDPNPSNGIITVMADHFSNIIEQIEIFSTNGKILQSRKAGQPITHLDLSYLANGIYFLKIKILKTTMPVIKPIIILKP